MAVAYEVTWLYHNSHMPVYVACSAPVWLDGMPNKVFQAVRSSCSSQEFL